MKHKMLRSLLSSPDQTQSTKVSILHLKHLCLKHLHFYLLSSNKPNSVSNDHTYIVATTVILNIVARESEMRIERPPGRDKKNSRCHRVNHRFSVKMATLSQLLLIVRFTTRPTGFLILVLPRT